MTEIKRVEEIEAATVQVTYDGREYLFAHDDPSDHIFSIMRNSKSFYELPLLDALASLLPLGSTVVDVGANIGTHSVFFAGAMGCKVVAIEANPKAVSLLRRNAQLNGLAERIEIRECAIGADRRKGHLVGLSEHNLGIACVRADPNGTIEILPLDHLRIEGDIGLLKVDVEGMEYDVLLGAMQLLNRCRPMLVVEAPLAEDYKRIAALITPLGYVPVGTYNYTPTHVFQVPSEERRPTDEVISISHRMALQYIQRADHTANVDRQLTSLRQQVRQLTTGEKAVLTRLDAALSGLSQATTELKQLNIAVSVQENSTNEQLGKLQEALRGVDAQFVKITPVVSETQAAVEALRSEGEGLARLQASAIEQLRAGITKVDEARATASTELDQQISKLHQMLTELSDKVNADQAARDTTRLAEQTSVEQKLAAVLAAVEAGQRQFEDRLRIADEASAERVAALGSETTRLLDARLTTLETAVQTRLDDVMRLAEQTSMELTSARETTLDRINELTATYEARLAGMETQTAEFARQFDAALTAVRRNDDVLVELLLLGITDAETKLQGLEARIDSAFKQKFDVRLEAVLDRRFADLGTKLAAAIGAAIADRKLGDEIADPLGGFDIAKAMTVLGIPSPDTVIGNGARVPIDLTVSPALRTPDPGSSTTRARGVWHVEGYSKPAAVTAVAGQSPSRSTPQKDTPSSDLSLPAASLIELDCVAGWEDVGWAQGETLLEVGGRVTAKTKCPRLGFVGRMIPCPGGGLVEFDVELLDHGGTATKPVVRLQTNTDFPVGHDFTLEKGRTTVRVFAPSRTEKLKLYVLLLDAPTGAYFRVGRIAARRLDADTHQGAVSARVKEPVLASMATIPSRREILKDTVASLLVQCDRVRVFLNNYPDFPDFLMHPRVEVRRSQDWDDRGDAGKFFWIDKDRAEGGYRLIVDDDLIFPPDFVDVMTSKVAANGNKAVFATHGVLLRQPIVRYYEPTSRAMTFHFGHALKVDRGVHVGATNALCFHTSAIEMTWDDFKYCNSADVWLALQAQTKALPVLTPARPSNWVRENIHAVPGETIYHSSLKRTRTRFDSSHVQDAVLRHAWPITLKTGNRAKLAVAIAVENAQDMAALVSHWIQQAEQIAHTAELIMMLAYDACDAALTKAVAELRIPHETHLIDTSRLDSDLVVEIAHLQARLEIDAVLAMSDRVSISAAANGAPATGVAGDLADLASQITRTASHEITMWRAPGTAPCLAFALARDEAGRRALALLVGTGRIAIAKTRLDGAVFDTTGKSTSQTIITAPDIGEKKARQPLRPIAINRPHTANSVFERVVVLNLDRRPDRWEKVSARMARAGIEAERFSAVDGGSPAVAEEHAAYAAKPLHTVAPELPKINFSIDLYMRYVSQMARIAHLEARSGKKAIASAGAWGYLRSYEAILERSLASQDETLLVFDDDIVLHKNFRRLFDEAISELPPDWLIVQLGTLQYNWNEPWARWRTPQLYQTNGAAIGSHAVGMRFEILPYLLDHTKRMDMPYDIGPLSAATCAFRDRCFVIYPNLAIQALDDSDIDASDFQKSRSNQEIASMYRWNLDDYDC